MRYKIVTKNENAPPIPLSFRSPSQKQSSLRPERRTSSALRDFSFATPAHQVSLNTTILIPAATNRGAPDHNYRFANGSQSDRRGFLSNSKHLSQILRSSRQMTLQNGPNTRISEPRDGFTTRNRHEYCPDARPVTNGTEFCGNRRRRVPVPDPRIMTPHAREATRWVTGET